MGEFLAYTRKGLFIYKDGKVKSSAFEGDPVSFAFKDKRDGRLYAALKHGHFGVKLHCSYDGDNWEEIETPAYPQRPADEEPDRCPMRGIEIPWNVEQIWAMATGGDDQPGQLWCGTIPGGLFKSIDSGKSWALVRSLWDDPARKKWMGGGYDYPGIHSICVDPRNSNIITIGVSCGGVWQSKDNGETWACDNTGIRAAYTPPEHANDPEIQDPHLIVQCANEADKFWIQHHNGIFKSSDNAKTWSEIEHAGPSVFGFAVAVHPTDGDTAWFVPAIKDEKRIPVDGKFVVTRTQDGGKTFDTLDKGLPYENAYDIVYRHGLAVDDVGQELVMGSTTGNLWHSPDQGDNWLLISSHLPPIHGVTWL